MPETDKTRRILEKELARLGKATEKAAAHIRTASGQVADSLVQLERRVENELTSDELWDKLTAVESELEALRARSERELSKLQGASKREFAALNKTSRRIARILLAKSKTRSARAAGGKPAAKKTPRRKKASSAKSRKTRPTSR